MEFINFFFQPQQQTANPNKANAESIPLPTSFICLYQPYYYLIHALSRQLTTTRQFTPQIHPTTLVKPNANNDTQSYTYSHPTPRSCPHAIQSILDTDTERENIETEQPEAIE
uniref:Uncharacterized protein n=1 Tax=Micrurus surinamensis TaxID=129470 RepID=A0A2D4PDF5_MICSU